MKAKDFLKAINQSAKDILINLEAKTDNWDISQHAINKRIEHTFDKVNGFDFFINTYFPHFIRNPAKSELHRYLFEVLPAITQNKQCLNYAIAAPRGEAKSTIVSKLYTLYRIITNQTHYVLIVMDSINQAYTILEAIKAELESNSRLISDYPKICGIGRVWQAGTIITQNNIKIEAAGAGKKLRGLTHGAFRPDLVILDDIENDENVRKPEQRDKLNDWLTKAVMPLGAAGEKMDIIYIGTILHYDSVLNRTLNNPAWICKKFKAITKMPDNMALWDKWESLYLAKQLQEAEEFYQQNKAAMEKGSQVSWAARPLLALMKIRASGGHDAFDSEYQNDPTAGDDAPFSKAISFWADLPDGLFYFGAVDPSLGKKGAGRDPSAILIGGLDRQTGRLYVVEALIKKRLPDLIIEDVISLQRQYQCIAWAIETVQFQEFLKDELVKRAAQKGVPIPARGIKPNTDKMLRIESLQPHMKNGLILLHPDQSTLISQLRHFPKADHDDGADALHMLFSLATSYQRIGQAQALDVPMPGF